MSEIHKSLIAIQNEIHAPKNQYNSFGKYKYRNVEDILEAAKPICQKHGCALLVQDAIEYIEGRFYLKATATLIHGETGELLTASAYAREANDKKGMDDAQITGATSSYARKYALNGLFCIDDTKDADSDEYTAKTTGQKLTAKAVKEEFAELVALLSKPETIEAMEAAKERARAFVSNTQKTPPEHKNQYNEEFKKAIAAGMKFINRDEIAY